MLLIDSLYINNSGGLVLLKYLIEELIERNVDFHVLIDERCAQDFLSIENKSIMKAFTWNRYNFYIRNRDKYSKVFCFANVPPLVKLKSEVYTYFHCVNFLKVPKVLSWKERIILQMKDKYIYSLRKNTDKWIIQTLHTKNMLRDSFKLNEQDILSYPFYDSVICKRNENNDINLVSRDDYVFVGSYLKGVKGHDSLIQAWRMLNKRNIRPALHLTISESDTSILRKIDVAIKEGARIINHGMVSHEEVSKLYQVSKATIYPSFNESFGLGIIEALENGCDVIGPDLPYIHSVCHPSCTFEVNNPDSIANAVELYEEGKYEKSSIVIENKIEELINLLTN